MKNRRTLLATVVFSPVPNSIPLAALILLTACKISRAVDAGIDLPLSIRVERVFMLLSIVTSSAHRVLYCDIVAVTMAEHERMVFLVFDAVSDSNCVINDVLDKTTSIDTSYIENRLIENFIEYELARIRPTCTVTAAA